ncbi:MAG: hypothetical protein C3F02_00950 [Parcubacteria group bacterium]|nr:MAG: hypothetical protein C3F02_00950 [Parcubacteria group bacterium]
MRFKIPVQPVNTLNLMRGLGYSPHFDNGSYIRRLSRQDYPHYHAYLNEQPSVIEISLHLDQKGACYQGQTAHSGEYGGEQLAEERDRIIQLLEN